MGYTIKQTVSPTVQPITLEEAKCHLRFPLGEEDENIENIYIRSAVERAESETNRQFITATFELGLDDFPPGTCPIILPKNPVQSVTSITYTDSAGDEQTLSTDDYVEDVNAEPATILPTFGNPWPATKKRTSASTVKVTFVAGYGLTGSTVPARAREAMFLLVSHYFYHREAVVLGTTPKDLPRAVTDLLTSLSYGDEFATYGAG